MNNEIELKLHQVKAEIASITDGSINDEVLVCGGNDFQEGYLHALYAQLNWLQDMVTNFCD
jgi:hypothetical protein